MSVCKHDCRQGRNCTCAPLSCGQHIRMLVLCLGVMVGIVCLAGVGLLRSIGFGS